MRKIVLYCEDIAHETVLSSLIRRLSEETNVPTEVLVRSATGGVGRVIRELRQFIRQFSRESNPEPIPDLMIIARDANCQGVMDRERELTDVMKDYSGGHAFAIPDPHIERWLLLDSAAFKMVFGKGCSPPDQKCDKDRYKELLRHAIRDADQVALLGGIEYAEDIVKAMDFSRIEAADSNSFGRFLKEMRRHLKQWQK